MRFFSLISVFVFLSAQSPITLSEIMFDPDENEYHYEFIEIFNTSSTDGVNLSGWMISDSTATDLLIPTQDENMILQPLSFAVIFDPSYFEQDSLIYDAKIPESTLILTIDNGSFGDRGF